MVRKELHCRKLIRITLDDGSHFDLAAEHELIMRDGTKKEQTKYRLESQ